MEIIPMLQKKQITTSANAGINIPDFIFVNNEGQGVGAGVLPNPVGNGTYENPYNMLATAETNSVAGDVIYLYFGDGTTANNDAGFTMNADQQLLGSGRAHTVDGVTFAAQTPGQTPLMSNTAGDGVTLANGAIVDGINVSQPTGSVISGSGVSDVTISNCLINAVSAANGIAFTGNCGALTVTNNTLTSPAGTGEGISVAVDSADVVEITGNTINSGFNYAVHLLYSDRSSGGDITIGGNTINNADVSTGVYAEGLPTTTALTLSNNAFNCTGSGALGVDINTSNTISSATITLQGNTITSDDYCFDMNIPTVSTVNLTVNQSNVLTSTNESGIDCNVYNETSTVLIDGNTITTPDVPGMLITYLGSSGSSTQTITVSNNNIDTAGSSSPINLHVAPIGTNPHNISSIISDNTISNVANSTGMSLTKSNQGNFCSNITGNSNKQIFLSNTGAGVYNIKVPDGEADTSASVSAANKGAFVDDTLGTDPVTYIQASTDCFP